MKSALSYLETLAQLRNITKYLATFIVQNSRANGNRQNKIFSATPSTFCATALRTTLGFKIAGVAEVDQGVEAVSAYQNHAASVTAITAIWATFGDIFFPSKTQTAIATLAREYFYCCFINEFHSASLQLSKGLCHYGGKSRMLQTALLLKGVPQATGTSGN